MKIRFTPDTAWNYIQLIPGLGIAITKDRSRLFIWAWWLPWTITVEVEL